MPIHFITSNQLKFYEVSAIIPEVVQTDLDLPEIQELDPKKIIIAKLEAARARGVYPVMVEDTALSIDSLNGLPGTLVKWFLKAVGVQGVYEMARAFPDKTAHATTVIGIASSSGDVGFFEGKVSGKIVSPRGTPLGWNEIFVPDGSDKTYGEMQDAERLQWSMRVIAAKALKLVQSRYSS